MLPHHLVNLKNDISRIYDFSNQKFMINFFIHPNENQAQMMG